MKREDEKYCSNCGAVIDIRAEVCPKCGVRVAGANFTPFHPIQTTDPMASTNSWLITVLLCFFLGPFGAHRFYNGKVLSGILQLLTLGACGIWYLIDMVFVLIGRFKDSNGKYVKYM